MIEKICEVIDGEYVCDIDISVEEWKITKICVLLWKN